MKIEPTRAAKKAPQRGRCPSHWTAAAVPTRTGATAAGKVRGRAAMSQILIPRLPGAARSERSWPPRELREVGLPFLLERLAPLARLLVAVEEEVGVVGELLDPGVAVLVGVEAGL